MFFTLFNLQGARRSGGGNLIVPLGTGFVKSFFQILFRIVSAPGVCVSRELLYLTRCPSSCQALFSEVFRVRCGRPADANFVILADTLVFVKHFFSASGFFPPSSAVSQCPALGAQLIYQNPTRLSTLFYVFLDIYFTSF